MDVLQLYEYFQDLKKPLSTYKILTCFWFKFQLIRCPHVDWRGELS